MSGLPDPARRLAQGVADRDAGTAVADQAADPRVIVAIDAKIQAAIDSGRRFSVNDIRHEFPVSAENLVGSRFRSFTYRRVDGHPLMVRVGHTATTSAAGHAREVKVWLGWDAAAAIQHPSTLS